MIAVVSGQRPIEDVLGAFADKISGLDPADTAAALATTCRGFELANTAGRLLAEADLGFAWIAEGTQPLFDQASNALRAAPSMPADLEPVVIADACGPASKALDTRRASLIRERIHDLAMALTTLLPAAARHASDARDRAACHQTTQVAHQLAKLL